MARFPTLEPIMMMRPPPFICFSAACVYVIATFAPSAARRLAIAAPMPREPPVMSATFPSNFLDTVFSPIPLISLFANPVAYVWRAVEKRGASRFTSPKEANNLHID
jgi:hypothetical protein